MSCNSTLTQTSKPSDIQGHRGCRGLFPENTLEGFIHAVEAGVTTIELDVVVSKDSQIIVSHEPWFNHKISKHPQGVEITEDNERSYNLFTMTGEEIHQFDVGTKLHPQFPEQQKIKTYKPTLPEVVTGLKNRLGTEKHAGIHYNIEIKFDPKLEGTFFPDPETFADLVLEETYNLGLNKQCNIQSFNPQILNIVRSKAPDIPVALLVDNHFGFQRNLDFLKFKPEIYSPHFRLVDQSLIDNCRKNNIKLIVWTVNEWDDLKNMVTRGLDGIITDYPDRALHIIATGNSR
jgi:glycerophosphoryl diester phosphodiesterase